MPSTTKTTSANPKQAFGDKKPPLALLPLVAHIHGAMAFYDGAGKYGKYNWRENPVEADTYVQAMLRHARLWENGEEVARDTGVHNLGGVIACAALLLDAQANGTLIDNRVKSQAACDLLHEAEALMSSLKAQHAARREAQTPPRFYVSPRQDIRVFEGGPYLRARKAYHVTRVHTPGGEELPTEMSMLSADEYEITTEMGPCDLPANEVFICDGLALKQAEVINRPFGKHLVSPEGDPIPAPGTWAWEPTVAESDVEALADAVGDDYVPEN